jgi:electron transfer flavoprotein alpha subunit
MAGQDSLDIWVFAEQRGGVLHDVGFELIGKARFLLEPRGGSVSAILLVNGVEELANDLIARGADRVILGESDLLEPYRLMPYVSVLESACRAQDPDIILFGATSLGVELAPRLAARLNTGLSAHCIDLQIDGDGKLLQMVPGWGGGLIATIKCPDHRPQMATVMPGVMKKLDPTQRSGETLRLDLGDDLDVSGPRVLAVHKEEPKGGMPLEGADVVVAGGWGVGSEEGWKLVEELAGALGGAVGATRPPVDEGWASEAQMIGQSGKTVRCRLYIGMGVSGMMHHVVGMDESDFIVAINTDPRAAIFEVSDLAIVGDYREIVPPLVEEIKSRLQK